MILDTFTLEELISALKNAVVIFKDRVNNYRDANTKVLSKKLKNGDFYKTHSGIINGQRYYYYAKYYLENNHVKIGYGAIVTVVPCGRRQLIIQYNEYGKDSSIDGRIMHVYTEHFLSRFYSRTGKNDTTMTLLEKYDFFINNNISYFRATCAGDILRRYKGAKLKAKFLETDDFQIWHGMTSDGDVAIIEQYGMVPVYRTYITSDMLKNNQVSDDFYVAGVEHFKNLEK